MNGGLPQFMPEYRLELGETQIPESLRRSITSLSFVSGLEAVDRVEITVHDPALRWLSDPLLNVGQRLALSLGYAQAVTRVFVGQIIAVGASFPSTGAVTLDVAAQDARAELQRATHTRSFAIPGSGQAAQPLPDVAVASAVVGLHALVPAIDPIAAGISALLGASELSSADNSAAIQALIRRQDGQSDFELLRKIAQENAWEIVVDHSEPLGGRKIRFLSLASELSVVARYEYGLNLVQFQPRLSDVGQVAKIRARFWVPELKTELAASVGYDWDRSELVLELSSSDTDSGGGATYELAGKQVNPHNVARLLLGELLPRLNRRLTAAATVIGNASLRAGLVVEIAKVGRFSGRYRVTEATHTIDDAGYLTRLSLRKEIWFDTPSLAPPRAAMSL